jgi:uncharacterized membrane protein YkvI
MTGDRTGVLMKKVIKLACVYAGMLLGAGFASGQELMLFFVRFGGAGIAGLFISGLVLAFTGWAVLDICARMGLRNNSELMRTVFGDKLSSFINITVPLFAAVLFGAMLSAAGSLGKEAFGLPFPVGTIFMAVLCLITFAFGLNGIIRINTVLTPFFIVGGLFFIAYATVTRYTPAFSPTSFLSVGWVWAAVVYACYNTVTCVSLLANLSPTVDNRKTAKYAGLLGGFTITFLGICFALPLFADFTALSSLEIPLLALAQSHGTLIEYLYILLLFSAIYTTAAANGYAAADFAGACLNKIVSNGKIAKIITKFGITILGVFLAHIGFSSLISGIYPIFGYIGLFEVITLFLFFIFARFES